MLSLSCLRSIDWLLLFPSRSCSFSSTLLGRLVSRSGNLTRSSDSHVPFMIYELRSKTRRPIHIVRRGQATSVFHFNDDDYFNIFILTSGEHLLRCWYTRNIRQRIVSMHEMNRMSNQAIKLLAATCVIGSVAINMSCHDLGTAPEELKPGRRDYIWTVDTLKSPDGYFYPSRIWGSASNDVWLACTGSPSTNLLWHFDGTRWSRDSTPRLINPSALWGFSGSDVWLGNSGNVFWRYNGLEWYKFSDVTPPSGFDRTTIEGIWGTIPERCMGSWRNRQAGREWRLQGTYHAL